MYVVVKTVNIYIVVLFLKMWSLYCTDALFINFVALFVTYINNYLMCLLKRVSFEVSSILHNKCRAVLLMEIYKQYARQRFPREFSRS